MTGEKNSSRWIHQRGNDSDTTGIQRGNGCSSFRLFGAAGAGMVCVPLACQGQGSAHGVDLQEERPYRLGFLCGEQPLVLQDFSERAGEHQGSVVQGWK